MATAKKTSMGAQTKAQCDYCTKSLKGGKEYYATGGWSLSGYKWFCSPKCVKAAGHEVGGKSWL
jgi:hypothetical protein